MENTNTTTLGNYLSGAEFFPDDMWAQIFQYLTPKEITNLKLVTEHMAQVMTFSQIATIVLQPLLNRLNKLGTEISTIGITHNNSLSAVLAGVKRVNAKQKKKQRI